MCFCTAHSFHEGIAPCIADACKTDDQTQTEQYAKGICSVVGVDLPSFQELLTSRQVEVSSIITSTTSTSISPPPTTNTTLTPQNGAVSTSSVAMSTTTAAESTGSASSSVTGAQSTASEMRVEYSVVATLVAA